VGSRRGHPLNRALDVAIAGTGLAITSPVLALAALAVKLGDGGPVLYRQTRVGKDGRDFELLKLRTMVVGAETQGAGFAVDRGDSRITRVGRFLRRTSLDELPQLFNVWRGEMSLVGPRPLVVDEDAQVHGFDRSRLHLTPGMTGHWQILGSARIPMDEMVGIDYLYVANWSLWTDVKILIRTIPYVFASRGM
jgi:lipopolysaccharide/colanic/teichoic acid biosynthesis glycosyltransferase